MDFGANLKAVRTLRGMTQEALALACGQESASWVTNYESRSKNPRNRRTPNANNVYRIAQVLQVPVSLLFSETPPESLENHDSLRSQTVRLDPAILRKVGMVLALGLGVEGLKIDLDRDAELVSLAYAWATDRLNDAALAALQEAIAERAKQGGDHDSEGRDDSATGRPRHATGRKRT